MTEEVYDSSGKYIGEVDVRGNFDSNYNYTGGKVEVYDKFNKFLGHVENRTYTPKVSSDFINEVTPPIPLIVVVLLAMVVWYLFPFWAAYRTGRYGWKERGCIFKGLATLVGIGYVGSVILIISLAMLNTFAPNLYQSIDMKINFQQAIFFSIALPIVYYFIYRYGYSLREEMSPSN